MYPWAISRVLRVGSMVTSIDFRVKYMKSWVSYIRLWVINTEFPGQISVFWVVYTSGGEGGGGGTKADGMED